MSELYKSVFKQNKVEKLYSIQQKTIEGLYRYTIHDLSEPTVIKGKVLSEDTLGQYDINLPLLEVGEEFYIKDINKVVKINKRMRSYDNFMIYFVEDEMIETERTKETLDKCIETLKYNDEQKKEIEELEQYKREHKYKHRFFNFITED